MKEFFKYVAATVVGVFLIGVIAAILSVIGLVGMLASSSSTASVEDNSVLVLKLSGMMEERAESSPLNELLGDRVSQMGLDEMLSAVRKARNNDNVKGIYIEAGAFTADSYASLQALRKELEAFRKGGKWIVAYADSYTQGSYYLASVANKVYLNPQGMVDWHGLASQPIYYKDMLAKFGVKVQVAKVGSYKSAVEPYTSSQMSDANREQVRAYINGIWANVCKGVGESRKLTTAQLNAYADSLVTFSAPEDFVKMKLVDGLLYTDQVKAEVKKLLGVDGAVHISQIGVRAMNDAELDPNEGDEVAVYYAYGSIVDGANGGLTSREHVIDAQEVCRDLEELMNDDEVKAVVLRVNSGGGSAYASEQIWHQIMELKKKKPVVVSMGGMAASGAYYISAPANWIIAEPTTLTGSIGIFGMFPDVSGLLHEKLGLTFDEVKTNKYSGFGTMARPFSDDEMAHLESYINRGYSLFRQRVADGRRMKVAEVEKVAQGHVWLGQDALKIKLVDQIGGLDEAVEKAAQLAKLKEHHAVSYPEQVDWMKSLLSKKRGGSYLDEPLLRAASTYLEPLLLLQTLDRQNAIQARLPFVLNLN